MTHLIPIPFFVITVCLLVRARFTGDRRQQFLFKPLSSLLFVSVALLTLLLPNTRPAFALWTAVGLLFGLGGDVALIFRQARAFRLGLVLFLVGHLIYTVLWTAVNGFHPPDLIWAAILLVLAAVVFAYLRPGLGPMQVPVLLYILVICAMVNRAISAHYGSYFTVTQAWLLTAGAFLFWLSDLMLAVNRFRRPFRAEATGLLLYYGGQMMIALSPAYFAP